MAKSRAAEAQKKTTPKATASRRLKRSNYRSFRLSKRIAHPRPKVLGSFAILKLALARLWANKKLFAGIIAIYLILTIILVKGTGSTLDIAGLKSSLQDALGKDGSQLATSLTLFGVLIGSVGTAASEVAATYQTLLLIVVSLVLIWALRQVFEGTKVTVKDAYYKSLYPLIPFLLVLLVISLQLLPLAAANGLYSLVIGGGLAVTALEKTLWLILLFLFVLLSLYMITSSIFALYIVTLPDMKPMQALRSARELVRHRRWTVMRKVIFLPFALLVLAGLVSIPVILFLAPLAEAVFFIASMFGVAITHAYMYTLYRELL